MLSIAAIGLSMRTTGDSREKELSKSLLLMVRIFFPEILLFFQQGGISMVFHLPPYYIDRWLFFKGSNEVALMCANP